MKKLCKRGHPRIPENLRGFSCKICELLRGRESRARRLGHPVMTRAEYTEVQRASRKTHCINGHPRTPENLKNNRSCRLCESAREKIAAPFRYANKTKAPKEPKQSKTYCKNGHPKGYFGKCRECKKELNKKTKAKKRVLKALLPKLCKRGHPKDYPGRCHECQLASNASKTARRRTRKTKAGGKYSPQQEQTLRDFYEKRCAACWKPEDNLASLGLKVVLDHVLPVAKGGSSWIGNLQPLCHNAGAHMAGCNENKGVNETDYRVLQLIGFA